jgi:hypothetical protein
VIVNDGGDNGLVAQPLMADPDNPATFATQGIFLP